MGGRTVMESSVTIIAVLVVTVTITLTSFMTTDAHQFSLVHKYAHLEGSPANNQGRGASLEHTALLRAHDRRRLAAFFVLGGSADLGLYYTAIMLGTPPQQHHVVVDTGSDLMWVHCAPCRPNCPLTTEIPGITLRLYDPALSSSDVVLGCTDANCAIASYGQPGQCTVSPPGACGYSLLYGGGDTSKGYLIQDVLTFQDSPTTTTSSNVYFGRCGTNQTGLLVGPRVALDGILGFGQAAVSVPTQLGDQGMVGKVFAHCLQGDTAGGGNLVIGNMTEPNITYTPMVPQQSHYNVYLQNIAVNGVNITDPASFTITPANEGVILDSGSTLAYLIEPAHSQFLAAIKSGAPVPSEQIPHSDGSGYETCWFYSGDIATTFPSVTLIFDGASMNLAPKNYLYLISLTTGESPWCMGWRPSTGYTLFGEIVLKDQLVVYDNYNQLIGWKPFNCSLPIPVV